MYVKYVLQAKCLRKKNIELASNSFRNKWIWCYVNKTEANLASIKSWLLDAFELFMLNVSCNSHCFLALCCALHRITSRVIHRTELYLYFLLDSIHIQWQNNNEFCWIMENVYKWQVTIETSRVITCYLHNGATQSSLEMIVRSLNIYYIYGNDPYAGSPTNTLLRLLLPLNDPVWTSFRYIPNDPKTIRKTKPKISLKHSIGSSDGRCVQRTGT